MMAEAKKFAVFDIDGTLIRWQLYHAVVDQLAGAGHVPVDAYARAREARKQWKIRSGGEAFRAYELELISAYEAALTTLSVADFHVAATAAFEEHKDQVYTYTRNLIRELKAKNYVLFAISASPADIVEMVAQYYQFDDFIGTTYGQKDGYFTGKLDLVIGKKAERLQQLVAKHGAVNADSVGVGDSDSDIEMLSQVARPIAFNPTRKLFLYAQAAGWKVVIERKNMIYGLELKDGSYKLTSTNS
jgi:HAD superfamily hydrolase (TIGR01490 family)